MQVIIEFSIQKYFMEFEQLCYVWVAMLLKLLCVSSQKPFSFFIISNWWLNFIFCIHFKYLRDVISIIIIIFMEKRKLFFTKSTMKKKIITMKQSVYTYAKEKMEWVKNLNLTQITYPFFHLDYVSLWKTYKFSFNHFPILEIDYSCCCRPL